MYNTEKPTAMDLPSTGQLIRSTIIAIVAAAAILITIVLPSEYGVDPTGIGRAIGLAEMGEIKEQLAKEAEEDSKRDQQINPANKPSSSLLAQFASLFVIGEAAAQTPAAEWMDEIRVPLVPGQGAEIKLVMKKGAKAEFSWIAENGKANFDLHGDGSGQNISYKKGRGVPGEDGTLEAAFDGNHGWFWRNRDRQPITIILRVRGDYSDIKKYL